MILAVDAGNSAVTLGCVEGRDILNLARLETSPGRSADEYAVLMERVLALRGVKLREFEGAAIASVVPPLTEILREAVKLVTGHDALVVGAGVKTGLNIGIDDPSQMGADLVAGAVAALDASVQAQVLNLLKEIQADFGLTYFFISHDLSVVGYMSDRVAVMYLGRIVEQADRNTLFGSAAHPYTKALLAAAPVHDPAKRHIRAFLPGELPSPFSPPAGCAFHPRCPQAMPRCREEAPELREIAPDHLARCHLYG